MSVGALISVGQRREARACCRESAGTRGRPGPYELETLGRGWVAEDALAIVVCCSLTATDFTNGVILAANHSGDSDSTAAITGNLLGVLFGEANPRCYTNWSVARSAIRRRLYAITIGALRAETIWDRYPGS